MCVDGVASGSSSTTRVSVACEMTGTVHSARPFGYLEGDVRQDKRLMKKALTLRYGQKADRDDRVTVCPTDRVLHISRRDIQRVEFVQTRGIGGKCFVTPNN